MESDGVARVAQKWVLQVGVSLHIALNMVESLLSESHEKRKEGTQYVEPIIRHVTAWKVYYVTYKCSGNTSYCMMIDSPVKYVVSSKTCTPSSHTLGYSKGRSPENLMAWAKLNVTY